MWKSFRFSWSLCHQVRNHAERCRTSNPVAHKSRHHTQYPFSSYTCNRQTSDHCKSDSNPTAEASARLGRESFRFAWHEGHCKFSVRTNTRASGTFPKHNGQARFHMVIKFVSFFLRHLGMPRPEHPERSPMLASRPSSAYWLFSSIMTCASTLWELPLPQHSESHSGFWPGSECQKEDAGQEMRESDGSSEIPARFPRSFLLRLDFFGWHATVCLSSSAGRNQGATHAQANRLCSRVFPLPLRGYPRSSA